MQSPLHLISWPDASRRVAFQQWLAAVASRHGLDSTSLCLLAGTDTSSCRYLRIQACTPVQSRSLIVMDAPPPQEDVRPFLHVAGLIRAAGLNVPQMLEADAEHGFVLMTDLGEQPYLDALRAATPANTDLLMRDALKALLCFQNKVSADALPLFDQARLDRELALFPDWCVQREFGITWTAAEFDRWHRVCRLLIDSALAQPQVAVHADWTARSLMVATAPAQNPGILNFQGAVRGPISYDLASLLRDAFISWPEEQELDWAVRWWQQARADGHLLQDAYSDFGEFWRALEWMGLQRHLKMMGSFCRLKHRDGKACYAEDLPRFFAYATRVASRYGPLKPLLRLLEPMSGARLSQGFTF